MGACFASQTVSSLAQRHPADIAQEQFFERIAQTPHRG
jgi:hypothetical protein